MSNVEEHPKKLASMGIANAYSNAHNIDKLTETIEPYKGKMAEMKEFLSKEEEIGRESKRKYEATLSYFERLQHGHQILEEERDRLKLSNEDLSKEKVDLENKVAELELQKVVAEQKAEQYETRVTSLEAQKSSLEVLLKV